MVVEEPYSQVFKLDHVRPRVVADGIAECQIRFPTVPIVLCEIRRARPGVDLPYRFLAAARAGLAEETVATSPYAVSKRRRRSRPSPPTPADVRGWAMTNHVVVSDTSRVAMSLAVVYLDVKTPWSCAAREA